MSSRENYGVKEVVRSTSDDSLVAFSAVEPLNT
jgi:hypothetical protein